MKHLSEMMGAQPQQYQSHPHHLLAFAALHREAGQAQGQEKQGVQEELPPLKLDLLEPRKAA
jgi:hypothetical protein